MKAKHISELEQEAMNVIWELQSCSVRQVLEKLSQTKKLAYTTISTILQRLYEKGLVSRKSEGMAYLYTPKLSKESYSKNLAQSFISKFFSSFGDVGVASFAQSIDILPKEKRDYLLELLEKYDETK